VLNQGSQHKDVSTAIKTYGGVEVKLHAHS